MGFYFLHCSFLGVRLVGVVVSIACNVTRTNTAVFTFIRPLSDHRSILFVDSQAAWPRISECRLWSQTAGV